MTTNTTKGPDAGAAGTAGPGGAAGSPAPPYIRDAAAIEAESFRRIRACTDLSGFGPQGAQVAMRVVHACGDPGLIPGLVVPEGAVEAGIAAVARGAPVLCDVEMLRCGLTRRYLAAAPQCHLGTPEADARARAAGTTRTMAAVDAWPPLMAGGIAAIGNAPTALFRLLEHLEAGAAPPALIVGLPVGFVGAAESKAALAAHAAATGQAAIWLRGRLGGSALAAACVNAIARLAHGERW